MKKPSGTVESHDITGDSSTMHASNQTHSSALDRELALEEEAIHAGIAAYRNTTTRLEQQGLTTLTNYGQKLVQRSIEPMVDGIVKFITDTYTSVGRHHLAAKYIEMLEPEVSAFITARSLLDSICKQWSYQNAAISVARSFEEELKFRSFETQNKALFDAVIRNLKHHPMGYQARVKRTMLSHTMKKFNISWAKWEQTDKLHLGCKLIDLFIENVGLVELAEKGAEGRLRKRSLIYLKPTEELSNWIMQYKEASELFTPKHLPMVCPPKPWVSPEEGGYFHKRLQCKLVKVPSKGYQKELRFLDMPVVYDAVNALQATPWKVNAGMHTVVKELWEAGLEVKGFPARLDIPLPAKPSDSDTNKEAYYRWKKNAGNIFRANLKAGCKRIQTAKILMLADKFLPEPAIWFPVSLDFRGRMYSIPPYLNPQSSDLAKSLLTFSEGKPLGKDGVFWLFVHAANCFGYDKCSLQERYDWTQQNLARIESSANDPLEDRWWMDADKPFQFFAAAIEVLGYLQDGGESYVCSLPIMVDGSCNGLQHFSAMLRDEVCGASVNLIPSDTPADIYQVVADAVTVKLLDVTDSELAKQWLIFGINRKLCKRPVMVLPYGGSQQAVRQYVKDVVEERIESGGTHPFGDSLGRAASYLSGIIWNTMKEVVWGPRLAMDWLQKSARVLAKRGEMLNWITPTGFWVQQSYPCMKRRRVETKIGDSVVFLTIKQELKDKLDSRKQAQAISPNFVHSLDASALALTIVKSRDLGVQQFSAIHDSYGTVAADMPVLLDTLRECFVRMYEQHDVLAEFEERVRPYLGKDDQLPARPNMGTLLLSGILQSDFFFA